jgi:PKD repeat protein
MKKILLALSLALSFGVLNAQVIQVGGPITQKGKLPTLSNFVGMPSYDKQLQEFEDSINDANKVGPWRFGYNHTVDLGLNNSGNWINLPNGDRIWRIGIKSKDAISMNLMFDDFYIPQGAFMHVFNPDYSSVLGAYAYHNNNVESVFGTELVEGDKIIVEYYEPAAVNGQGRLNIGTVTHGYRELSLYAEHMIKGINDAGDCNIDVLCPLGIGWEDQIQSVAMIVSGGNGACTGALINNTCEDGTTYFLTADHCLGGNNAPSTMNWAFRFNWHSPTPSCATTTPSANGPYSETAYGAALRANDGGSDFALLELTTLDPDTAAAWGLYYAGWDRTGTPATSVVGIHHPSGDIKKICEDVNGVTQQTWGGAQTWRVADWDDGVTEPGSSGSPLFDQNGRIVGQLYGGSAACSGTNDNGAPDYYGCFHVSWTGGGTNTTRLSNWLDPGCDATITQLDGYDPNQPTLPDDAGISVITEPSGTICGSSVTPEFTLKNYGTNNLTSVDIDYDFDGGAPTTMNWTGNLAPGATQVITLGASSPGNGPHTFNAVTSSPNGNTDSNPANDNASSSFTLIVNGELVDFNIDVDCWGSEIDWELEDAGLNVVASGGPYADGQPNGGGSTSTTFCLDTGCYTFTINDSYGDGMYGSQYGSCSVDGYYNFTNANGDTLIEILAANSDFGNSETQQMCVVAANLNADFTYSPTSVCVGETVDFTDASSGIPTSWTWTINGGTPSSSSSQNVTGVVFNTAGTYDVILDVNDGTTTSSITQSITVNNPPSVSGASTDISCFGANDGTAMVTASGTGPFTYLWSNSSTGASLSNLSAGIYSVDVTDASGCVETTSVIVSEPAELLITNSTSTDASCGANDGSINLTVTGGTGSYQFSSDGGVTFSTANPITNLGAGSYNVVVEDQNGCQVSTTIAVNNPNSPTISGVVTDETCDGDCDGEIDVTVSGGTAPYTYSWCQGSTTEDLINLCPMSCDLTVVDANNCLTVTNFTVGAGMAYPSASASADNDTVYLNTGATINFSNNSSGGSAVNWDFGDANTSTSNNPSHTYSAAGTYQVVLTSSNGPCSDSDTITIVVLEVDAVIEYDDTNWSVYPNPAESLLTIELNHLNANSGVMVYGVDGKLVYNRNLNTLNSTIDVSEWAKGSYVIRLISDSSISHRNVIVK